MLERISRLIKSQKISASQFADEIGVQRSSVSHVLSGRNKPSLDFITKIINSYPDVNSDWLLTGKGNMWVDLNSNVQKEIFQENSQTSIDLSPEFDQIPEDRPAAPRPEKKKAGVKRMTTGSKAIERIVLFYNDGTFIDFSPNK
jgi:transcriptional regulator with XRE-family HTH domain